jgi:hypothetical protein
MPVEIGAVEMGSAASITKPLIKEKYGNGDIKSPSTKPRGMGSVCLFTSFHSLKY